MTVREIADRLGLRALAAGGGMDAVVGGGYTGDLLSDVMANAGPGQAWITIQVHQNVVAVALLTGVAAVIIAGGREPQAETLARAQREGIPVLVTEAPAFEVAGRLYRLLEGNRA